ncbi:MAG: mechanosensitive ion channel family protein [Myxococcales bacterium]|nr:mechanosensitive ion channel family protein [Myxococcales bacterium]
MDSLPQLSSGTTLLSLTNAGVLVALLLVAVAAVLLPRDHRRLARGPFLFLVGHLAFAVPRTLLGLEGDADRLLGLVSLLLLLLSLGHGTALVLIEAVLTRRLKTNPPKIFRDIVTGLVYVAAVLLTLRAAGVDTSSLLTTSALLTAIIGLSLQDTLGNLFAGLSLQGERPFGVGDWIQYEAGDDKVGQVVEINWRATKVKTLDQVELTVPNGQLARASIMNFSRPSPVVRRSVQIDLPRTLATHRMQRVILAAMRDVPGVRERPEPSVLTQGFEDRGVRYWVRFFIDDFGRRFLIDGAVRDRIWYALARENVAPAVPVREVFVHETGETVQARNEEEACARTLAALREVELLQDLNEQQLLVLANASQPLMFADREVVIRQGDRGDSLYVCQDGALEVEYSPELGRSNKIARFGPGGVCGELSAMTGEPRTATVRAVGHTELLRLDKPAFQSVLDDNPKLAEVLSARLASRRAELDSLKPSKERTRAIAPERDPEALLHRIRGFFGLN